MVRLVILAALLSLAGCAQQQLVVTPSEPEPMFELRHLDEGQHSVPVAELLRQAEQARAQYRLQLAAGLLDQARQIEPRNPEIFYRQAWLELKRNNPSLAESLCRRGLVFALGDASMERRLQALLADSLEQQGRLMDALIVRGQLN